MSRADGPTRSVSWSGVCARRLQRHGLSVPMRDARPADVVSAMCGAHAQVLSAAELSVALRMKSVARTEVQDALWQERSLVKTFGPRGTVHLLPTRDLPLWTGALSAVPSGQAAGVRLTAEQNDAVVDAVEDALSDAELTLDELDDAVARRAGAWAGERVMPAFQEMWPRWRVAISEAARRGVLCFGPNRGRKVTYTSPQRWLPGLVPDDGASASAELLRRYLHAYGPATPRNYAQWLAAPTRWATALFDVLEDELERVDIDGAVGWVVAGDDEWPAPAADGVRLLPYFDAYVVGCHPRERVYPGRAAERALAGSQAGNFPVLLVDGAVAGVWHHRRSGRSVDITVEPLAPLSADRRKALATAVDRVAEILQARPRWTLGTVSVGPHA